MRRAQVLFLLSVLFAGPAAAAEPARAGPYQVTLMLPPSGLYAGEEMEIEFRVERLDGDPARGPARADLGPHPRRGRHAEHAHHGPLRRARAPGRDSRRLRDPSGLSAWRRLPPLPDGPPPEIQPVGDPRPTEAFDFEFPLVVLDATSSPTRETAKVKPYLLDVVATPRRPVAGEPVDLELRVRLANSFELREVTDFDVQHENRTSLTRGLGEHRVPPRGPGRGPAAHAGPLAGLLAGPA